MARKQVRAPGWLTLSILILCSWFVGALPESHMAAAVVGTTTGSLPNGLRFIAGPVNGAFVDHEGKTLAVYGDPSARNQPLSWF